jgi:4-hydroxybenzoate polyprenyltransferase
VITGLIRTMRPRQWIKNLLIFAPLTFDVKLFNLRYLAQTVAGFVLLCLISGSVYVINDLADAEKDRQQSPYPSPRCRWASCSIQYSASS